MPTVAQFLLLLRGLDLSAFRTACVQREGDRARRRPGGRLGASCLRLAGAFWPLPEAGRL